LIFSDVSFKVVKFDIKFVVINLRY